MKKFCVWVCVGVECVCDVCGRVGVGVWACVRVCVRVCGVQVWELQL